MFVAVRHYMVNIPAVLRLSGGHLVQVISRGMLTWGLLESTPIGVVDNFQVLSSFLS